MTVAEHRARVGKEFQQAQEQAQRFGQQATQWAQRVLYLQGQLDLLQQMDTDVPPPADAPAPKPGDKVLLATRAERRRQEKANGRAVSPPP